MCPGTFFENSSTFSDRPLVAGVEMWVLLFGTCLIQQWNAAGIQLIYLLLVSLLIATLQHDRLLIDVARACK